MATSVSVVLAISQVANLRRASRPKGLPDRRNFSAFLPNGTDLAWVFPSAGPSSRLTAGACGRKTTGTAARHFILHCRRRLSVIIRQQPRNGKYSVKSLQICGLWLSIVHRARLGSDLVDFNVNYWW